MIWGALRLFQATSEMRYLAEAERWIAILDRHYWDAQSGGYFTAADTTTDVIVRLKTASDDATPSANAVMVSNLAQLGLLKGDTEGHARAEAIVQAFSADLARNLAGHTGLLAACLDLLAPQLVVTAAGDEASGRALHRAVYDQAMPGAVEVLWTKPPNQPAPEAVAGKTEIDGQPAAYVCLGPECALPVSSAGALETLIARLRQTPSVK